MVKMLKNIMLALQGINEIKEQIKVAMAEVTLADGRIVNVDEATLAVTVMNDAGEMIALEDGEYEVMSGGLLVVKDGKVEMPAESESSVEVEVEDGNVSVDVEDEMSKKLAEKDAEIEALKNVINELNIKIQELEGQTTTLSEAKSALETKMAEMVRPVAVQLATNEDKVENKMVEYILSKKKNKK